MRNALVFRNVWHAWAVASGTHAGSGPATPVAEVSDGVAAKARPCAADILKSAQRCMHVQAEPTSSIYSISD
jgi:hypothetical protein